jgi:hypothetical protein
VAAGARTPLAPSPLAGEGGSILTQILTGGGQPRERVFSKQTPSHSDSFHKHQRPPPQKGEGKYPGTAARGDASRCGIHVFTCQTALFVPAARCARVMKLAAPEGGGAPTGALSRCRACEARRAPCDRCARLSALHRGDFWAPGPRFRLRHCLRSACSEAPRGAGRSAWRADSRASRTLRLRAAAAGRHASLRLQDRLRRRPSMSETNRFYDSFVLKSI